MTIYKSKNVNGQKTRKSTQKELKRYHFFEQQRWKGMIIHNTQRNVFKDV